MAEIQPFNDLVSVVIPVYNRTQEVKRAIQSVLNQNHQNFEILVVDDGSVEDIKSVCNNFDDERIRFFRNETHTNANRARNIGILNSRGEYIAMLDSDDEFLPGHIERRLKKIKEWDCDGIFGSAYYFDGITEKLMLSRPLKEGELMINYLLSDGIAPTTTYFFKKKAAREILWDETLERHQDFDFTVRFVVKYKFYSDYEPTVRRYGDIGRKRDYKLDSCIKFINKYRDSISKRVYNNYHRQIYRRIASYESKKYVKYYALNSYKYIYFVSFNDFLTVHRKLHIFRILIFLKFIFLHISAFMGRSE